VRYICKPPYNHGSGCTTKALSNSCLFTFANVDPELQHRPVPKVYPATYAEDARYLAAHRSLQSLLRHSNRI
jgi:hypothetical protein